jgi:hypothetical protein
MPRTPPSDEAVDVGDRVRAPSPAIRCVSEHVDAYVALLGRMQQLPHQRRRSCASSGPADGAHDPA